MTLSMLIFGVLVLASACGVVLAATPLYSALSLVVTLFLIAAHFALLGAQFVATMQVLVYAGAIMVLVIFVIMLLGLKAQPRKLGTNVFFASIISVVLVLMLWYTVRGELDPTVSGYAQSQLAKSYSILDLETFGTTKSVGQALYTRFLFPFELTSVLLLAAIIGAVVLSYEPRTPLAVGRGLKAKHTMEEK